MDTVQIENVSIPTRILSVALLYPHSLPFSAYLWQWIICSPFLQFCHFGSYMSGILQSFGDWLYSLGMIPRGCIEVVMGIDSLLFI